MSRREVGKQGKTSGGLLTEKHQEDGRKWAVPRGELLSITLRVGGVKGGEGTRMRIPWTESC